jgi:hypothetical protein
LFFFISLSNSLVNNLADCLLVDMSWPEQVPGTLRLVNLHFGRDIGDGRLCNEVPLIWYHLFPFLCLLIIAYICVVFKALSPSRFLTIS